MALLKSPYELSLWGDVQDPSSGKFIEKRKGIIGSNTMTQEWRAQNVQLTKNVNGSKTLTFTMYSKYIDNMTGQEVANPYTALDKGLKNEDKLKLKYKGKWYDFIIKNVTEDSSSKAYTYSATDLFINELSKNGFDVILDYQKLNNFGTVTHLGDEVLADTDWEIDELNSDVCVQTKNEFLALITIPSDTEIYPLLDPTNKMNGSTPLEAMGGTSLGNQTTPEEIFKRSIFNYARLKFDDCDDWGEDTNLSTLTISDGYSAETGKKANYYALGFYSSCTTKPRVFQFILLPGLQADGKIGGSCTIEGASGVEHTISYADFSRMLIDDDGNIVNPNCQYIIECAPNVYTTGSGTNIVQYPMPGSIGFVELKPELKANRYVVSTESLYLSTLDKYVEVCKKTGTEETWYHYSETEFVPPNLMKNCVGNNGFKNTSGWKGAFYRQGKLPNEELYSASPNQELGQVFVEATVFPDPVEKFKDLASNTASVISQLTDIGDYSPRLKIYHTSPDDYYIPSEHSDDETNSGVPNRWRFDGDDEGEGDKLYPVLIEQGFYSKRTSLTDVFCQKGSSDGDAEGEGREDRGQIVIAWCITKTNEAEDGTITEEQLINKDDILQYIQKITIEDSRYNVECGRYANFNTINGTDLTKICAELNLSEDTFTTKQVIIGKQASTNEDGETTFTEVKRQYCYAIVDLKHNYSAAEYEAAAMKTVIHLTPITTPTYDIVGQSGTLSKDEYAKKCRGESEEEGGEAIDGLKERLKYSKTRTTPFYLEDFQIFKYYPDSNDIPIFPGEVNTDGVQTETHWYFKNDMSLDDLKKGDQGNIIKSPSVLDTYPPKLDYTSEKKRVVDAKESNCFNIIQTLAEQFECWAEFSVNRDGQGKITPIYDAEGQWLSSGKKIKFKKYVGKDNYAGIQYGVNLKQVQRTNVSDALVTKMIVKMNMNQNAENGFCSIARAASNPTKESFLLDFAYYFKQGLMGPGFTEDSFNNDMHLKTVQVTDANGEPKQEYRTYSDKIPRGTDIEETDTEWNYFGLYDRLKTCNTLITAANQQLINKQKELLEAESTYDLALKAVASAEGEFESAYNRFTELAGPNPFANLLRDTEAASIDSDDTGVVDDNEDEEEDDDDTTEQIATTWGALLEQDYNLRHYYQAMVTAKAVQVSQKTLADTNEALVTSLKASITTINSNLLKYNTQKARMLNEFYKQYSRFIQEGTWIDEKYVDDELYFLDAQQTLYNSCWPQVTYNINAVTIDMLPGYEYYNFDVGDKTWVQDTEFFGKNNDGTPYKKEIIVSETVNNLDSPDQDTFKVQTFKNQFQDLFKKITATVQSVQYSEGSYNKAALLAKADGEKKYAFLEQALNGPYTVISNAKNQQVYWDDAGLTVGNKMNANEALRLTSAAVMFQRSNEQGELEWKTGITPDGISADLITAGQINTGIIQIMNNDQPSFRWDSHGLVAYDFTENAAGLMTSVNKAKGVIFNKYGLYGIDLSGTEHTLETWYPRQLNDVLNRAAFSLTWDGLNIKGNDASTAKIGKHLYEDSNGDTQTALIRVVRKDTENKLIDAFRVNQNGNVEINGTITATEGQIGDWFIGDGQLRSNQVNVNERTILSPDKWQYVAKTENKESNITTINKLLIDSVNTKWLMQKKQGGELIEGEIIIANDAQSTNFVTSPKISVVGQSQIANTYIMTKSDLGALGLRSGYAVYGSNRVAEYYTSHMKITAEQPSDVNKSWIASCQITSEEISLCCEDDSTEYDKYSLTIDDKKLLLSHQPEWNGDIIDILKIGENIECSIPFSWYTTRNVNYKPLDLSLIAYQQDEGIYTYPVYPMDTKQSQTQGFLFLGMSSFYTVYPYTNETSFTVAGIKYTFRNGMLAAVAEVS